MVGFAPPMLSYDYRQQAKSDVDNSVAYITKVPLPFVSWTPITHICAVDSSNFV